MPPDRYRLSKGQRGVDAAAVRIQMISGAELACDGCATGLLLGVVQAGAKRRDAHAGVGAGCGVIDARFHARAVGGAEVYVHMRFTYRVLFLVLSDLAMLHG